MKEMGIKDLKSVDDMPEPLKQRWDAVIDEMLDSVEMEAPDWLSEEREIEITKRRASWWEEELNTILSVTGREYRFDFEIDGLDMEINAETIE